MSFQDGHTQKDGFSMGLECGHPNTAIGERCSLCGKIELENNPTRWIEVPQIVRPGESVKMENIKMERFDDGELAALADWAELQDRNSTDPEVKKAYGALRQGSDWLLRWRAKQRQKRIETAGQETTTGERPQ